MRLWKRILLLLIGVFVVVVSGAYVYLWPFKGLERIARSQIEKRLENKYPIRIGVGAIQGSLLTGITLRNVTVVYVDFTTEYRMVDIPLMHATYSLSAILSKDYTFSDIAIDSASVTLRQNSDGKWLVPSFASKKPGSQGPTADHEAVPSTPRLPHLIVDELQLNGINLTLERVRDTLRFSDVNMQASANIEENTVSADLKKFGFDSNRDMYRLKDASGKLTYTGGELYAQDMEIAWDDNLVKLSGRVDLHTMAGEAKINSDHVDLDGVRRLTGVKLYGVLDVNANVKFGRKEISGTLNTAGTFLHYDIENLMIGFSFANKYLAFDTVYGSVLGGAAVDGSGDIDFNGSTEVYTLDADVRNFNLNNMVSNTFSSDLTGRINLRGSSFSSAKLQLKIDVDLFESSFDRYALHTAKGSMFITTDSLVLIDPFTVTYYENTFVGYGPIVYSGNIDLNVSADLGNLDRFRNKLFISEPGGRGKAEARFTGLTGDPDLAGTFKSDSAWIYGLYSSNMYGEFNIKRFLTGQRGSVSVRYMDGYAWNVPYDTGYDVFTVDSTMLYIDTAFVINAYATATAHGSFNHGVYPQRLILDTLTVDLYDQALYNQGEVVVDVDSVGFDFIRSQLGSDDAHLTVLGTVGYDQAMNLDVKSRHVQLSPWLELFASDSTIDGVLSVEASVGGDFESPVITAAGSIDSLVYIENPSGKEPPLFLGNVYFEGQYDSTLLVIDSVVVNSHPGVYRANGYLHADLAFTADSLDRLPDKPFDIHITSHDRRFDLVSVVLPSVENLTGDMAADIQLSGTPSDPHLEGFAYLKSGRLKYFDLVDTIYTDSATAVMKDNQIIIDGIQAYVRDRHQGNRKSFVDIDGSITVLSLSQLAYDLDVSIPREFPFTYELEDIKGVVEGDMHVEGESPPTVTGSLTLLSMTYRAPFAEEENSPILLALAGENTWNLDLEIDILSNFWIKNEDLDAQFSGNIQLVRQSGITHFLGQMEIIRGSMYMFDKIYRFDAGGTITFNDIETLNPELDLVARTRILGATDRETKPVTIELPIHITGTLEAPEINPVEGSSFTQQDILPILFANQYSSGDTTTSGALGLRVTQLLGTQFSQFGSRLLNRIGVETFEIDPAYQGELDPSNTSVTLGFYTAPGLYVYGRTPLGLYNQEYGFEYRLNRSFVVEGKRSDNEEYILNIKLHWDF